MMKIYIFECESNNKLHGFTFSSTSHIFPTEFPCSYGWKLFQVLEIEADKPVPIMGIDQTLIISRIKEKGYYLSGDEVNINEIPEGGR